MHYTYEIVVLPAIIKITIVINNILNIFVSDIFVRVSLLPTRLYILKSVKNDKNQVMFQKFKLFHQMSLQHETEPCESL